MNISALLSRLLLTTLLLFATACATPLHTTTQQRELPPTLAQDEIFRPYTKVGVVEVNRTRMGHIDDLVNEADEWANDALGAEAAKMGADAVMLPEMRAQKSIYIIFPVTTIKARGVAIRFN